MFLFSTYAIVIPIYMDLRVSHRFDICNETICSSLAAFFMLPQEFLFVTFIEFSNNFSHIFYVSFVCLVCFPFAVHSSLGSAFPLSSLDSFSGSKWSLKLMFLAFFQVLHDICYANKIIRAEPLAPPLPLSLSMAVRTQRAKNNGRTCWPFIMWPVAEPGGGWEANLSFWPLSNA